MSDFLNINLAVTLELLRFLVNIIYQINNKQHSLYTKKAYLIMN